MTHTMVYGGPLVYPVINAAPTDQRPNLHMPNATSYYGLVELDDHTVGTVVRDYIKDTTSHPTPERVERAYTHPDEIMYRTTMLVRGSMTPSHVIAQSSFGEVNRVHITGSLNHATLSMNHYRPTRTYDLHVPHDESYSVELVIGAQHLSAFSEALQRHAITEHTMQFYQPRRDVVAINTAHNPVYDGDEQEALNVETMLSAIEGKNIGFAAHIFTVV